jgi:type I restriction enzyme M protein
MGKANHRKESNGPALGFEAQLWAAADKMRGHMDASEYKHVCLGLIFLKYISDAFEEKREQLLFGFSDPKSEWFIKDELTAAEIQKISDTYHSWRGGKSSSTLPSFSDQPGFCKSVKLEEIQTHGYVLTPGRYVGAADVEDDGEPFEEKLKRLTATLEEQFTESAKLEKAIRQNLKSLSHA